MTEKQFPAHRDPEGCLGWKERLLHPTETMDTFPGPSILLHYLEAGSHGLELANV